MGYCFGVVSGEGVQLGRLQTLFPHSRQRPWCISTSSLMAATTFTGDGSDVVSQPFNSQPKLFVVVRASVRLLSGVVQAWHGRASTLESRRGWCMGLFSGGQDASGTSRINLGRSGGSWSMICLPWPLSSKCALRSHLHVLYTLQTFVN